MAAERSQRPLFRGYRGANAATHAKSDVTECPIDRTHHDFPLVWR
jgi:hypothetical protein